ncbi:glycosyltransferase family 2 protein [Chlorobium phaeovibrioides]|uniref:Glycosyltransferase family 2 protein n=1 Tax=Chlorobium phaeovibrioides TaxID=1094 RepID=A0A5M8ICH4_CHLPH|nr:glycosyltransferase family 2 protein [Chlorobium phaeovibrioides]KAA6232075.1 glycosyltransferase family 2 protein [Chlorobium phaeovibrioides]
MRSPVLFLTYKRFRTAEPVFEAIRQAKPPRLYFASNAPNPANEGEDQLVQKVRNLLKLVDWPCEVYTLFHEKYFAVKYSIPTAIDWFFEHEEEGIILEDDVLPHPDFFMFCETLLHRYAEDHRVWMITGDNFQDGQKRGSGSYYFSRYTHIWGWATWRRAWKHYDIDISYWKEWNKSDAWRQLWSDNVERHYWEKIFNRMFDHGIDTWDYQWTASAWYHGGLTATPNVNLVSNIGFGEDATHTTSASSSHAEIPVQSLGELMHPAKIEQDKNADRYAFNHAFGGRTQRFPWVLVSFPKCVVGYLYRRLKQSFR